MNRYERQIYFDRLCELRDWYLAVGEDDTRSVLNLSAVERFVEATWAAGEAASLIEYLTDQFAPLGRAE
jgi:hypothetical protein